MRSERNTKEEFLGGVQDRIKNGHWGLDEIEYLLENHSKYHLNYDDIGVLLNDVYKYTYYMALEDGVMDQLEVDQLTQINKLIMAPVPQNKAQREELKFQIRFMARKIEQVHAIHEKVLEQEHAQYEPQPEPEPMKERVNKVYYKSPRPKLTPYTYYSYSS
jgi:hypothetical protein